MGKKKYIKNIKKLIMDTFENLYAYIYSLTNGMNEAISFIDQKVAGYYTISNSNFVTINQKTSSIDQRLQQFEERISSPEESFRNYHVQNIETGRNWSDRISELEKKIK